jgi:hypothetical protein
MISFILWSALSMAISVPNVQSAIAYFTCTMAYTFLLLMFGYIFFTWMEVIYYAEHPSWSESRLRKYKHAFLLWLCIVGFTLGVASVVLQAENAPAATSGIQGQIPLVVAFEFHAVVLSISFVVCLYKLFLADKQYSRFTDLFRRLTKLNLAFLGCLVSLLCCTIVMLSPFPQGDVLRLVIFTIFFVIPPMVIPPFVMWFFNPYTKLLKDPEEDLSGYNSGPQIEEAKNDKLPKCLATAGCGCGCFSKSKDAVSPRPAQPVEEPSESARPESESYSLARTDSQATLNPNAPPAILVIQ